MAPKPFDGLLTDDDVIAKYERLDRIFAKVKAETRLRTAFERGTASHMFRERDGIYVHFDRRGVPVFGNSGCHRLGMALALGLDRVPAYLGVIHAQAEPWRLPDLERHELTTPSPPVETRG